MLGLSSSYFAFQKKGIYDSAKAIFDLGFDTAELGAAHLPEKNVWEALKKIKRDFPDKSFTVHGLFPPREKRTWFNASLGLTAENKKIIQDFFKAATILEADVVSIHPGFRKEVEWIEGAEPMEEFLPLEDIQPEKAWPNFFDLAEHCLALAEKTGCAFAIENVPKLACPLVWSEKDFDRVFADFSGIKLLLDVGHALYEGRLSEFLECFPTKVAQIHLHLSREGGGEAKTDEHLPITSMKQLEPLKAIRRLKSIPMIFEHGSNVSEAQIRAEKKLVEEFLTKL